MNQNIAKLLAPLQHGLFLRSPRFHRDLFFAYKRITESWVHRQLKSHLAPGMIALDIGANIGVYTRAMSDAVGERGCVYSFEPAADNFVQLQAEVAKRTNVTCVEAAVGASTGTTVLYRSQLSNVDHHTYPSPGQDTGVTVNCIAIDDYLAPGTSVGLAKIDVQGHDVDVLEGMARTVASSPHMTVIGELWPWGLNAAGRSAAHYIARLREFGFSVRCHHEADFDDKTDSWSFATDFVAVRKP